MQSETSLPGSLSLERLGLETFFGTSRLISVLKVERLGLVSVSSRSREFGKIERLGLVSVLRDRLSLEDITSWSRSRDFSLVNIHAMHQACVYIAVTKCP